MSCYRLPVLLCVVLAGPPHLTAAPPPDIVLMVADDLGYADLGCYGGRDVRTPNIDRLARQGVRFAQFYSNGPECTPTRTALLTGRYQQRIPGLECAIGVGNAGRYDDAIALSAEGRLGLPPAANLLPAALVTAGYRAYCVGKWHLGYDPPFRPLQQGFHFSFGPLGGGVDYFHHTEPRGLFLGSELPGTHMLTRNDEPFQTEGYLTELIVNECVRLIAEDAGKRPYFLYVPFTAPHTPLQGPRDYDPVPRSGPEWNSGERSDYVDVIAALDQGVGRILRALDDAGTTENTLVFFVSDNGPTAVGDTGPYRGLKGTLMEGGIHVPCVARWPGRIPAGMESHQVGITMDLSASILRAAGAPDPANGLDGIDLLQGVQGSRTPLARTLYWRARRGERTRWAIRHGWWKYLRNRDGDEQTEQLVNLQLDPAESDDCLQRQPQIAAELRQLLSAWEMDVRPRQGLPESR